jgi:PAS domain S-box-containing protein
MKKMLSNQLTNILQTALDGVVFVDRTGRLLEVNQAYCDMSGYTREALQAMHLSDLDGSVSADKTVQHFRYAMDIGLNRFEALHYRSDHTPYNVELSFRYIENDIMVIFIRDISEQKQAEACLRDSEKRFRSLFDHSNDGILLLDFEGNIQDANPKMQQMLGYQIEELLPLQVSMLHPEAEHDTQQWALKEVKGNQRVKFTTRLIRKDASLMDVEVSAAVVDQEKKVIQGVIRDITEQKMAAEKLSREVRLNTVVEKITRKLLAEEYDVQQAAEWILNFAKEYTGSHDGYIAGQPYEIFQNQEKIFCGKLTSTDRMISIPVMLGDTMVSRISLTKADSGFTPEEIQAVGKLATLYAVVLDKEQSRLEKQHSDYQRLQNQKLRVLSHFARNIAGYFKQICTPLTEYAEHLQKTVPADLQVQTYMDKIINGIHYANDMALQLLTFSQQSWQEIKPVNLRKVTVTTIEKIQGVLPGHIRVEFRLEVDDSFHVMAESFQMEQILIHLIGNACYAMEDTGGTLTIGLRKVDSNPSGSLQDAIETGGYAHLFVRDTGCGMNVTQLKNIFEPRLTVKPNHAHCGPELYLIRSIIESYQGETGIKSTPGEGTTVDIYLPLYGPEEKRQLFLDPPPGQVVSRMGNIECNQQILSKPF